MFHAAVGSFRVQSIILWMEIFDGGYGSHNELYGIICTNVYGMSPCFW